MKQCSKRKDNILLALVAAHEQLLWVRDLLFFEEVATNEEVGDGVKETLEAMENTLGTAALDVAAKEAEEHGYCDLCNELRRITSCDHCPFNGKNGSCWIGEMERQDEIGWQQAREKWIDEQGRKRVIVHGEAESNESNELLW